MSKKRIDCSDLIGSYDIKGANEVVEKLKGRIDDYYVDLFNNLIEQLFHLSSQEAKVCVDEFISENPEILDMYTKESLYAMAK